MTREHEIIRDNNKIIVEFLNWEKIGTYTYKSNLITEEEPDFDNRDIKTIDKFSTLWDEMKFNSDWNWLMEVVDKIFSEECIKPLAGNGMYYLLEINIEQALKTAKIEAVYNACVEFIKWYNEQK